MSPHNPQLGQFIKQQREAVGKSMYQLSREIGVNRSSLHYWEQGAYEPEPQTLELLARGLDVSYEDLFALSSYATPTQLPEPEPYLRAKYPGISQRKLAEAKRLLDEIDQQYGDESPKKRRR